MSSADFFLKYPKFICLGGTFSCVDVIFEYVLFVENGEGEVGFLDFRDFSVSCNSVIDQINYQIENNIDWLTGIVDHLFGGGGLVIQVLR